MALGWVILSLLVATLVYIWFDFRFGERRALAAKMPSPPKHPIFGFFYYMRGSVHDFTQRCLTMAPNFPGKVVHVAWLHRVAIGLWNPSDVEFVLGSPEFLEKSQEYRFFKPWLGNGLLISSGETWRTHRRLIAPTFHLNVLKQFIHLFNRNSKVLCARLEAVVGKEIDIHDYMSESTVEVLLETAMGVDRSTQQSGYDYALAVMKMCTVLHRRHFRPWLWPTALFNMFAEGKEQKSLLNTIHALTREVLKKRRAERKAGMKDGLYKRVSGDDADEVIKNGVSSTTDNVDISYGQAAGIKDDLDDDVDVGEKKRMPFLDQMLEIAHSDGQMLSDQEVEEQVNTIMFEGHDTTAAASSFFLSLMGVHRDIQERCVNELREIFGDSDRPATFQDTLEMKYLERCIMETIRLFPPVPIIARNVRKNVKIPSGYVLPEGSTIVIGFFLLHRDPDSYPNPEEFNPDNFLPERCASRHFYTFTPFSAGPRSCVGRKYAMLKLKILLSTVLRRFEVHADMKENDFQLQGDIILKRKEGFPIRLYSRNQK